MNCTATALIFIVAAALVLPKAANGVCCYLPGGEGKRPVASCADDGCPPKAKVFYEDLKAKCSKSWQAKESEEYGYLAGSNRNDANAPEYECVFKASGTSAPRRRFFSHRLTL